jgi:hypothetical protein
LVPGSQVITVTATDTAGNVSTATLTVIWDNTPPVVQITSPTSAASYTSTSSPLALGGTASDAGGSGLASIAWKNVANGVTTNGSAVGLASWTASIALTPFNTPPGGIINNITITATDAAGNQSTATIAVTFDNTAAAVTITTPTTSATYSTKNATLATLAGTAAHSSGIASVGWRINSPSGPFSPVTSGTTSWTVTNIALSLGTNVIDVQAIPNAGLASAGISTITVIYDNQAPVMSISSPTTGATFITNASPIVLSGPASDAGGSGLESVVWGNAGTLGAGPATVSGGTWTASIPLTTGSNSITVTATDGAGNVTTATITVTYDTQAPSIAITAPTSAPSYATGANSVALGGTMSDSVAVSTVTWSTTGAVVPASGSAATNLVAGTWSIASVHLVPGSQIITVTVTNAAGTSSQQTITVDYDNVAPTATITTPTSGATYVTNDSPLVLGGTASDNLAVASVAWSNAATGGSGTATGTSTWTVGAIALAPGSNVITVTATDSVGNPSVGTTLTVTYDVTPPTVAITAPTAGGTFVTASTPLDISGTASDNVAVSKVEWRVNGGAFAPATTSNAWANWSVTGIALVAGQNTIHVRATDTAGNSSTATLDVTLDTTAPTIAITSPTSSGSAISGTSPFLIGGTASDNVAVASVTWSNPGASPSSGTASGTDTWNASVPLVAGLNTITVKATDTAGNTSTASMTVTYDTTPPTVTISTNGGAGFATNTSPVALAGTATDPGGTGVTGVTWMNAATGGSGAATFAAPNWTLSVPLAIGSNTITVVATDAAGNNGNASIIIMLDTEPPSLSITSPTTGSTFVTKNATVDLGGTASDNVMVALVEWRNNGGTYTAAAGTTAWTASAIPLVAGLNTIDVRATDSAGNTFTRALKVTYDNVAPTVTITSPTSAGTYLTGNGNSPLSIGGTASDNVGVALIEWRNNGGAYTAAAGTTSWSASVPLVGGTNTINVRATDTAGNTSTATLTVTYSNSTPGIAITTNGGLNFATNASPTSLAGTATPVAPAGIASVTWSNAESGGSGTATGTAAWTASVPVVPGANLITVVATDTAGNSQSASITVTLDTVVPSVSITTPTTGATFVTKNATVTLGGTASDNVMVALVEWRVNNGSFTAAAGTSAWTASGIPLVAGTNVIDIRATDSAGNTFIRSLTVTRDNVNPTVAITSPTSGPTYATGATTLILSGTAADNVGLASVGWSRAEDSATGAAAGTASWTASIPLLAGTNTLTVTATDMAGNTAQATITVTQNSTAPSITITAPTSGATYTTNVSPVAMAGTASGIPSLASVTWSNAGTGGSGTATGTTSWAASVPLELGVNVITVTAMDLAGNMTDDVLTVTFDIVPPTVSISTPTAAPTFVQSAATLNLGGSSSDNVSVAKVEWTNNGSPLALATGTNPWTVTGIPLVVGTNVITVKATDTAGNSSTATLSVTRDNVPPAVAITVPTSAATWTTNQNPLPLAGTASDNVAVSSVSWSNPAAGASGPAAGTNAWSASVPLVVGANTITVTATDTAGTPQTAVITVTYDNTAPSVVINAPTASPTYATNIGPVALGGTASDDNAVASVTWSNAATGGSGTATGTNAWSAMVPLTDGVNTITVTATDTAGNTASQAIAVTFDTIVPSLAITSPTTGPVFATSATSIGLGGTSSDNVAVATVTWTNAANSTSGTALGTTAWSVTTVNLVAGDNVITVTATDTAGNTTSQVITIKQDSVAPTVAFTLPTSGPSAVTNATPLAIAGTASDNVAVASVSWSNPAAAASGAATGTSSWSAQVPLAAGSNTITVTATDTAGNQSTAVLTVIYDNTPPTVSLTGPTTNPIYYTGNASVTVSGTSSDNVAVGTVGWSNAASGGSGTAVGTGSWSAPIPLTPGTNLITITVRDTAGNVTTKTITVIEDTQPPTIAITTPAAAATWTSATTPLNLGGTASDNVIVASVKWANSATGATGTATGTTAWSAQVDLVEGANPITVTAADAVGNTSTATITVTYDNVPPTINITAPTTSSTYGTTTSPLDISGNASDNLDLASVTWANTTTGTTGTAVGTDIWSASVPLAEGSNTVVFTATDGVGNTTTATLTVTYDTIPPVVTILSPAPPSFTTQARPILITGTATDNVGVVNVTWSNSLTGVNGTATFAAPNWSASISFVPGANLITVQASDAQGNIGSATLTVNYSNETIPPTLAITAPTSAATYTSTTQILTVSGTGSDDMVLASVTWINTATGVTGIATGTNTWSADVPLTSGLNTLIFTATDGVGNTTQVTLAVTFAAPANTIPPSITITAPSTTGNYTTTSSPVTLHCTAVDNVGVAYVQWTNGNSFGDGICGWGTFWYANIPLVAGANVITVTAVDTAGLTATDQITVTFNPPIGDLIPPIVTIVSPNPSGTTTVGVPSIDISGTASDNVKVATITVANTTAATFGTATGTTTWSQTGVALLPGVNILTARAIDPSGNIGTATVVVVYTPPAAAKPVAPVIPAGHCGLLGMEILLPLVAVAAWRRRRREGTPSEGSRGAV